MAHKRRHSRGKRGSRKMRGGSYTSGSTYGSYVNGAPDAQFNRTFDVAGQYGSRVGSEYVGAQGQNSTQFGSPSAQNLSLIQSAGKRRRSRRGGFLELGGVINQAIVPFSILGMQQTYRKKSHGGRRTRRHRR
jgi:hypothetical protein